MVPRRFTAFSLRGFCSLLFPLLLSTYVPAIDRPNLVVIMTDNHGAWTLGCYGNPEIRTPNIDRLAREGMLFTQAFASNPVCSPTRATFLTGLLPSQHGVHCYLRAKRLQIGPQARNTLEEFTSLPEILRANGYRCGLVGKWHLGDNLRPQEGFDEYWVTMPDGGTTTFYGAEVIEDGQIRKEPEYLTDFWTRHAETFLEQSRSAGQPFFLYLAYNGPYALGASLNRPGNNRHAAYYADKELSSFPHEPMHPWLYNNRTFHNNPVAARRVATEVSGVDDGVGRVMAALERLGLAESTVVMFLGDQGWAGGHGGFTGMGDHTRPLTARDRMMQIPLIVKHAGKIPEGVRSDLLISNYDLMPTLLGYLGLNRPEDGTPRSPGQNYSAVLRGEPFTQPAAAAVYMEFETLRAIRTRSEKYVQRYPNGPDEYYEIDTDPTEQANLSERPSYSKAASRMRQRLDEFFDSFAQPKYDIWNGGGAQTALIDPVAAKTEVTPVAPPQLPDGFRQPKFDVPEGYVVELAAGPPLIAHPMMAGFDDQGRLYVAESAGLNLRQPELEEQLPNSIVRLEDRDGDGRFDRSTVFADKLTLPMGALWHGGSLYVAAPPNIWKFTDRDDDGVADERIRLVTGFGYNGNAASIHGCFLGPDGRIYWCDGRHGHEFRDAAGNVIEQKKGSYIFSCRPDGSDVRAHCGGGMDNPVEVDFTNEGEMLGTVNILYRNPRIDCLVHWLYGGTYPHHESVLDEYIRTGDLLGPVHKFGHVAVSGMTRYRSGALDRSFRDDIFVTIFNTGRLQRIELQREGATFVAAEREFLSSPTPDFHPTDVLEDADGSLLLVDTGGWFRIGCPTSQIAKPELMGAIYRIRREGMPKYVDPRGLSVDWSSLGPRELVRLLGDTRTAVAERAIDECARLGRVDEKVVPELLRVIRSGDPYSNIRALWSLARMGTRASRAAVISTLQHEDWTLRLAACRAISAEPDVNAIEPLLKLLASDGSAAIRRESATALGRCGDPAAIPRLLAALPSAADRAEEHAIIYALIEIRAEQPLREGLASKSPGSRRGALIALSQLPGNLLSEQEVAGCLTSHDAALRSTAAEILAKHPEWATTAARQLRIWLSESGDSTPWRDVALPLIEQGQVAEVLGAALADASRSLEVREQILFLLRDGVSVTPHESWNQPIAAILGDSRSALFRAAIDASGALKGNPFGAALSRIAGDERLSQDVRLAALSALTRQSSKVNEDSVRLLLRLLESESSGPNRLEAARIIGELTLNAEQLIALAERLPQAGPLEIHDLVRPYLRSRDVEVGKAFIAGVRAAPGFWSLQPHELSDIIKLQPEEMRQAANPVLQELLSKDIERRRRLDAVADLVSRVDASRGRELFFSEKSKCSTCHRIGDQGGRIGPDLSRIGRIRSPRDLTEAILFPSSSLVREFQPYVVADARGRVITGLIVRETAEWIDVQPATGDPVRIQKSEIEAMKSSPISIMPDGLDRLLPDEELGALVAYLSSLK